MSSVAPKLGLVSATPTTLENGNPIFVHKIHVGIRETVGPVGTTNVLITNAAGTKTYWKINTQFIITATFSYTVFTIDTPFFADEGLRVSYTGPAPIFNPYITVMYEV